MYTGFLAIISCSLALFNSHYRKTSTLWTFNSPRLNCFASRKSRNTERGHTENCHKQTDKLFYLELLF